MRRGYRIVQKRESTDLDHRLTYFRSYSERLVPSSPVAYRVADEKKWPTQQLCVHHQVGIRLKKSQRLWAL